MMAPARRTLAAVSRVGLTHGRHAVILLACASLAGCRAQVPTLLFDCRVPFAPIQQRLAAEHVSVDQVKVPRRRDDFLQFVSGKRYAFVLRADRSLVVAPLPIDAARNPYSHAVLALGEPVVTAGGLTVIHATNDIIKVIVDSESAAYCPTPDSAHEALAVLARAGIPVDRVLYDNRARVCVEQPEVASPSMTGLPGSRDYGDVMVEMERRFKLAARAVAAQQGELADYELVGLLRSVRDDLPQARPPETAKLDRLIPFARTFVDTDFPFLRQAVWDGDWPRARDGVARMAATCNDCHATGNVPFLEVDATPDASTMHTNPQHAAR